MPVERHAFSSMDKSRTSTDKSKSFDKAKHLSNDSKSKANDKHPERKRNFEKAQNGIKPDVEPAADSDDDDSSSASVSTEATTSNCDNNRQTRKRLIQKTRVQFKYSSHLKEDHSQALFGASFNYYLRESCDPVFATVGSTRVTVYKCPKDGSLVPQFVYCDPDTEENLYSVAWSYLELSEGIFVPVLAAAGHKGIIRVIQCFSEKPMPIKTFVGHGNSVNDLKFHPSDPSLLFSASKDHSVRLWNIRTTMLVAIFGGVEGHRDEVLGVDVHPHGQRIVTCGMDHSLKIWRLDTPEVQKAIKKSFALKHKSLKDKEKKYKGLSEHYPDFSTREVHHNYVDCVAWHGNSITSKSCEHDLKIWRPIGVNFPDISSETSEHDQKDEKLNESFDRDLKISRTPGPTVPEPLILTEIEVKKRKKSAKDVNIWYLKFGFDFRHTMLAIGDGTCKTHIYDMSVEDPMTITSPAAVLTHPKCVTVVRVAAFSFDGDILVTTCDDGSVFRWDRLKPGQQ